MMEPRLPVNWLMIGWVCWRRNFKRTQDAAWLSTVWLDWGGKRHSIQWKNVHALYRGGHTHTNHIQLIYISCSHCKNDVKWLLLAKNDWTQDRNSSCSLIILFPNSNSETFLGSCWWIVIIFNSDIRLNKRDSCVWVYIYAHRAPVLVALALIESGMKYEDAIQLIRQ